MLAESARGGVNSAATAASATAAGLLPPLRLRQHGIYPGVLRTGPANAITDVDGVIVGHVTLHDSVAGLHTGGTAVLPHSGNLYQDKVPCAVVVGNGFGKLAGSAQVAELGELETPILLTNTLAVGSAMQALVAHTLKQAGNEEVRSVNALVGETNDGQLSDIRSHHALSPDTLLQSVISARGGPVPEGSVGAGAGTMCYSFKGGIGTSSRLVSIAIDDNSQLATVGVLLQSNFGRMSDLSVLGVPIGRLLGEQGAIPNELRLPHCDANTDDDDAGEGWHDKHQTVDSSPDGSLMLIVATDAPLGARQLRRMGMRALMGLARTNNGAFSNGSGDFVIAFSTAACVRLTPVRRGPTFYEHPAAEVPNDLMDGLFRAAAEAAEEAVYNSLWAASTDRKSVV